MCKYLELTENELLGSTLLSYLNDCYGCVTGFIYQGKIFAREFEDQKFLKFIDVSEKIQELYQKIK